MGKGLTRYWQITGGIMLVGLCLWLVIWWWQSRGEVDGWLRQTPGIQEMRSDTREQDEIQARQGLIIEWRGEPESSVNKIREKMREWEKCWECVPEWQVKGGAVRWQDAMIVTANHVVPAGKQLFFYNYELGWREVIVITREEEKDIAWAQIESEAGETLLMSSVRQRTEEIERGLVVSVWQGGGEIWQEIEGKVLEPTKQVKLQAVSGEVKNERIEVIEVMMESNLGMSGLPVWTSDDELVGIVVGVDIDDMAVTYVVRVRG